MDVTDTNISFAKDLLKQKEFMGNGIFGDGSLPTFESKLNLLGIDEIKPVHPEVFQVNIGYMCNQICKHCHVDAGPDRKEIMTRETMKLCLEKLVEFDTNTIDITGGAPEMNPDFRWFIEEIKKTNVKEIIVRSNLTIILANPKYKDLPEFFRDNNIRIVSSLPYYHANKTDRQRGNGVFDKSIKALQMLNNVGYGKTLNLDLVYNPSGAYLPGDQSELERDYKKSLFDNHGIIFNNLFAITNLPINRFLDYLVASGNYEDYMEKLIAAFNPSAIDDLMCRNTLSIDYLGNVFDCDFNQMLKMGVENEGGNHLSQMSLSNLKKRRILTGQHCYGCTAGAGSSCQGTLT